LVNGILIKPQAYFGRSLTTKRPSLYMQKLNVWRPQYALYYGRHTTCTTVAI